MHGRFSKRAGWTVLWPVVCLALLVQGGESADIKVKDSLTGTTWSGRDSDGDQYVFTFEGDGTLAYTSPSGSYRNGKWYQSGTAIYFHMNDHYSEYLGEINGTSMHGRAWNTKNRSWTWQVTKKP